MHRKLSDCKLFRDVDPGAIEAMCRPYAAPREYARGDIVAAQGARCGQLMILCEGQLMAETAGRHEEKLGAEMLLAPEVIAPGCLFCEHPVLPFTLTARTPAGVLMFRREDFLRILQDNAQVLTNFLEMVCSPARRMSEQSRYLGCKTIKGKIARYLLDRAAQEGMNELRNPLTQREMADLFGVTRPALARALGELSAEGTIYVKGKRVDILFGEKLKQYIK